MQAPENQALVDKLTQIAGDDPNKALIVMSLLASLNGPETGANNLVAIPMAAGAVVAAVGAVLVASDATVQEKTRIAANALVVEGEKLGKEGYQQIRTSIAVWELVLKTEFPAHQLDPKNLIYITPIIMVLSEYPSIGGFADGSVVNPATNTGGTQLDGQRDDGKYVTPEHRLDPGNMYSEGVKLKGLNQNRPLRDLTHQEIIDVFSSADIDLSNHAVGRLKDPRTKSLGFETPNDIAQIFNQGAKFDAGDGAIGYAYRDLEAIVNPVTSKIVTIRPAKKRDQK